MMKISAKTEYGLRCLLLLARQPTGAAMSISEIARQDKISKHYAEQILLQLRRAGFVKSIRGTQGGFALEKNPAEISIGAILRVLEGVPFEDTCDSFNKRSDCGHLSHCSIRPVWQLIMKRLWEALDGVTLHQLVADEQTVSRRLAVELPVLTLPGLKPDSGPGARTA